MIFYVVRKCAVCFGIGIASSSSSSAMTSFILTNSSSTCSFNFLKVSSSFLYLATTKFNNVKIAEIYFPHFLQKLHKFNPFSTNLGTL